MRGFLKAGLCIAAVSLLGLLPIQAKAQGWAIQGQAVDQGGRPLKFALVRVCPYTASGTPCSPLTPTIWSDIPQTHPVSNPYTTDQTGNFSFVVTTGQSYIVQVYASTTLVYSYLYTAGSAGSGAGTVTNFSSGNLTPLFTTSVTNPTTTPALSFSLSSAANDTFYGNFSGSTGAPSFWTLAAGSNITLTPNTGTKTLTVAATGGGGSGCSTGALDANDVLIADGSGACTGGVNAQLFDPGDGHVPTLIFTNPSTLTGDGDNLELNSAIDPGHNISFFAPHFWEMDCTNSGDSSLGCGIELNASDSGRPDGTTGGFNPLWIRMNATQSGNHPAYIGVEIDQSAVDGVSAPSSPYVGVNIDGPRQGTFRSIEGYDYLATFDAISNTVYSGFHSYDQQGGTIPANWCAFLSTDSISTFTSIDCTSTHASTFNGPVTVADTGGNPSQINLIQNGVAPATVANGFSWAAPAVVSSPSVMVGPSAPCTGYLQAVTDTSGVMPITCGSGGGTPGGSNQQIQYNNSGSFAGATGVLTNGTHSAMGAGAAVDSPDATYSDPSTILNVMETHTDAAGWQGIVSQANWSPSSTVASQDGVEAINGIAVVDLDGQATSDTTATAVFAAAVAKSNTTGMASLIASEDFAENLGAASIAHLWGVQGFASNVGGGGVSVDQIGVLGTVRTSGGFVDQVVPIYSDLAVISGGTVSNYFGEFIAGPSISGGAVVTKATGLHIDAVAGATTNYQIYSAGTAPSVFLGPITAANFIDSALTPGTSPICPNGTAGAFTTSGCSGGGGGNTTSTALTTNKLPKANGANSIIDSSLSDDGTKLSSPESLSLGGASNGGLELTYTGSAVAAPDANSVQFTIDGAVATPYNIPLPVSAPTGTNKYMNCAADPCVWDGGSGISSPAIVNITGAVTISGACALSGNKCVVATPGASVTFSSIPGAYSAIQIMMTARSSVSATSDPIAVQFNSDTGTNYSRQYIGGSNTSAVAGQTASDTPANASPIIISGNTSVANTPGMATLIIPTYAGTAFNKEAISNNFLVQGASISTAMTTYEIGYHWASTSAITQVVLTTTSGGNFVAGSTFTIYGIP